MTIIGTGNVANQLAHRFILKRAPIDFIIGRNEQIPAWLSDIYDSYPLYTTDYSKISPDTDLIIIAVSDDAIPEVAQKLSPFVSKKSLVVHTSGSVPSSILKKYFENFGGLYPLQTFTKNVSMDFEAIPVFYNAYSNNPGNQNFYEQLIIEAAHLISPKIFYLNDADRLTLHIAAVFANNFINHLFSIAQNLLAEKNIPFEVLLPLIHETVRKIETHSPLQVQTGPAIRGDMKTIENHLDFLKEKNLFTQKIYEIITKSILNLKK